jgi:hypothetical protein
VIGMLRTLAQRRKALVALSDAQRTLLGLDARALRERKWAWLLGAARLPHLPVTAGIAALGLVALAVARPRGALKLASTALAIYPIAKRLLAIVRAR